MSALPLPPPSLLHAEVLDHRSPAPKHWVLTLDAPEIAAAARPGQFVMLRAAAGADPLLPRALSLFHVDGEAGLIEVLFRVVGSGTRCLAALDVGDFVTLWGPLGKSFSPPESERLTLVGGGVGVPPLVFLAEVLAEEEPDREVIALLGAATADYLVGVDEMRAVGARVQTATDDGSAGQRGLVTTLLERSLVARPGPVLACGPLPMLAAVARIALETQTAAEVCMEAPMACGVVACVGCTVPGSDGRHLRVCCEGPVFPATAIDWEALST